MSSAFGKLNLRPHERRLLVFVATVVFIVLNIWLVWPRFKDWRQVKADYEQAFAELRRYQKEVEQTSRYEAKLRELESLGSNVIPEEQELDLVRTVQNQTRQSGVFVTQQDARPKTSSTKTNQFFEEQTLSMSIESRNEELVNFLVSLASTNSLIRVQELRLRPDNPVNPMKLMGNATLVSSYQKNPPVKSAPPPPATNVSANAAPTPRSSNAAAGSISVAQPIASKVQPSRKP
ncbi:MAG: hypothetical protein HYY23_11185 [Verrucomicrobia bacterium]|nr:hypothetical protein [Verrucomicrobiota bacterium]